jgi:hypothetical protein
MARTAVDIFRWFRAIALLAGVPLTGLGPVRPYGHQLLRLTCIPFHHKGLSDSTETRTLLVGMKAQRRNP